MLEPIRQLLRRSELWIEFQEVRREGWGNAWRRFAIQPKIRQSPPVRTAKTGDREVRILTWRRDWLNALWALKSFYYFSGADYPLYIHDGGLQPRQAAALKRHFPDATIIGRRDAERDVEAILRQRGLSRCLAYRRSNVATWKVFDFFLLSRATSVISIDSDIVFFRSPSELLAPATQIKQNLYNRDLSYAYSMTLDELEQAFGIRPPPLINSGLSLVARGSIDFTRIEGWLANPKLFADRWVTEQTLHALCSTIYGVGFLPPTYMVSTSPGLNPNLVCKHYPGYFRPLLYTEGMRHLHDHLGFPKRLALVDPGLRSAS